MPPVALTQLRRFPTEVERPPRLRPGKQIEGPLPELPKAIRSRLPRRRGGRVQAREELLSAEQAFAGEPGGRVEGRHAKARTGEVRLALADPQRRVGRPQEAAILEVGAAARLHV